MSGFRPRFFLTPGSPGGLDEGDGSAVAGAGIDGAASGAALTGTVVVLDSEDSHHALRVLRLRAGDECEVVVGAAVYAATVQVGGGEAVRLLLGEPLKGNGAGASYEKVVALVQALPRPSALDWAIEKSTEAGVSLILLVQTAGSPRPAGKEAGQRVARWTRLAREAAKQSKQPAVPSVEALASLSTAVERVEELGLRPVLLDPDADRTLYDLLADAGEGTVDGGEAVSIGERGAGSGFDAEGAPAGVALFVGPESGWTVAERDALLKRGLIPARLGRGVLRTETAGPVAVVVARLALGDW